MRPMRPALLFLILITVAGFGAVNQHEELSSRIAAQSFPTLYASMGTPLYEALTLFEQYEDLDGMKSVNRQYRITMLPIYHHGMDLDRKASLDASDRSSYLRELRTLEAAKKRVMAHLTGLTMEAIERDDFDTFKSLVALPLDELLPTLTTRTEAINYYKKKPQSRIKDLETLAKEERRRKAEKRRVDRAIDVDTSRDYRLVQHLPTTQQNAPAETAKGSTPVEENGTSTLKAIGEVFKSMDINFDPGLLEDYKSHKPPTVDDVK